MGCSSQDECEILPDYNPRQYSAQEQMLGMSGRASDETDEQAVVSIEPVNEVGDDRLYSTIKFDGNARFFSYDRNDGEACLSFTACKSHCCDPNSRSETGRTCQAKKRDWAGIPYCPSECVGKIFGSRGTC